MDVDNADDFDSRSSAFLIWLQENGVSISPKIELSDQRHRNAGRAVVATQAIAEDEELFSIPRSSILTPETSTLPRAAVLDDPWLSLITAMIYEHGLGTSSKWAAYLNVLPTEFDTLMFWSDHELKELAGSAVVNKIGKADADKSLTEHVLPVVKQHFNLGLDDQDILVLAHRFGSTIMSFAFDLEKPSSAQSQAQEQEWEEYDDDTAILAKGMVPLADMLNADADRNNAKLFYEDDAVIMRSTKPIEAGEEIFNDYGPLPRADLLRRYGYITENYTKYDVVEIPASLINTVAGEHQHLSEEDITRRIAYLDSQGVTDDGYDIARPENDDGQFSEELSTLLNALAMPEADFAKLQSRDVLPRSVLSIPAAELLYAILVRRRAEYPMASGAAHDETKSSYRISIAKQVIRGEKECLRLAAEAIQDLLSDGTKKRKAVTFEEEAEHVKRTMTTNGKS